MVRVRSMRKLTLLALLAVPGVALSQAPQAVPTMPVGQFLDSLGVNTHSEYTDGTYVRSGENLLELQYLGIHNVRDAVPTHLANDPGNYATFAASLRYLLDNRIHLDLLTHCNTPVSAYIEQLDLLAHDYPHSITAVEGTNEVNNQPCTQGGGDSVDNGIAFQQQLYAAVHGDPALAGVPVYDLTGVNRASSLTGRADYANNHPYPNASRGTTVFARMVSDYSDNYASAFPRVITEDGYYTSPDKGDGVDETSQAVGELQIFLSAAALGIPHTYLYELKDAYFPGTAPYATWGLFSSPTGAPKQSAKAIHNLTTALGWLPQGSSATTVNASISGAPADSHTLALTDAGGGVLLFVWRDISPWSVPQQQTIIPPAVPVTVSIQGHTCSAAYTFDPLHNAVTAVTPKPTGYTIGEEPYPIGLYCAK